MKVKVTKNFQYRGEPIEVGTILTIRDEDLPRLAHLVTPLTIDGMQAEYFTLLSRFWSPETENAPMVEIRRLVNRIDFLYRDLHQAGRKVPIRLPIERLREHTQEELAL